MICQLLIDSQTLKHYPVPFRGRYRAKLCSWVCADDKKTEEFLVKVYSSTFRVPYGTQTSSLIVPSFAMQGIMQLHAPEFVIESYGTIDIELSLAAGTCTGVLDFALLTLDLEPLDE